ncbi:MAG: hypothetical protein R6X31_06935 [Anaerolineae bacterium]
MIVDEDDDAFARLDQVRERRRVEGLREGPPDLGDGVGAGRHGLWDVDALQIGLGNLARHFLGPVRKADFASRVHAVNYLSSIEQRQGVNGDKQSQYHPPCNRNL